MNEQKPRATYVVAFVTTLTKQYVGTRCSPWHLWLAIATICTTVIGFLSPTLAAAAELPTPCVNCPAPPGLLGPSQGGSPSAEGPKPLSAEEVRALESKLAKSSPGGDAAHPLNSAASFALSPLRRTAAISTSGGGSSTEAIGVGQSVAKVAPAPSTVNMWLVNGLTVIGGGDLLTDPDWSVSHVGDFNGDGKKDILWRNTSDGRIVLWLMNGFTVTAAPLLLDASAWIVTHVADFNGDGKSDILLRNGTDNRVVLWIMNGTTIASSATILADPNWNVTHTGDFNFDGKADILWRNKTDGQIVVWTMNGTAVIATGSLQGAGPWLATHVADFNGDGKTDILLRNSSTGDVVLWTMFGVNIASGATLLTNVTYSVTHVGDFNGDGKADILWRNRDDGTAVMWTMSGSTVTAAPQILGPSSWVVTHVADFNGDGKADILWRNTADGNSSTWLMNGVAQISAGGSIGPGPWSATHTGDFNGDGKADILWRSAAAPSAISTGFVYDKNGRLTGVLSGSEGAKYNYDPAGNILSIDRLEIPTLSILGFSPSAVEIGSNFAIRGTGFWRFASGGEVRLNGALLSVVGISPTQLTVTAPSAPTSGILTVTLVGTSASSASPISVIAKRQIPSITSFSPTSGPAGTSVTISGNWFNGLKELNSVAFNNRFGTVTAVTVSSGSSSTMTAVVPEGATSGPISVATPEGEAASSSIFTVVPTGYTAAQTSFSAITLNGPSLPVSLADPFTLAVSTFNLAQAQSITLGLTSATIAPASGALNVYVLAPDGSRVGGTTVRTAGTALVLPDLFQTGTYSIVIERGTNTSAALTLTLSTDVSQPIGIDQTAVAAVATRPGQRVVFTFNGTAGSGLSLVANGFAAGNASPIYRTSMVSPSGVTTVLNDLGVSVSPYPTVNVSPLPILTENGPYRLIVTPLTSSTPSLTYEFKSDELGTAIAGLTSSTSVGGSFSGGRAKSYTFTWPGGAKLALEGTILSNNMNAYLYDASNTVQGSLAIGNPAVTGNLSTGSQAGTYRMRATTTSSASNVGTFAMKAGTVDMCPGVTPSLLSPQPAAPYPVIALDGKITVGLQNCGSVAGFPPSLNIFQATNMDGTGGGVFFYGLGPAINEVVQPGGGAQLSVGFQLATMLGLGPNETLAYYYPQGLGARYIMIEMFSNTSVQRRAFGPYCFGRGASFPCS
jgi:YD repeat-containing protein